MSSRVEVARRAALRLAESEDAQLPAKIERLIAAGPARSKAEQYDLGLGLAVAGLILSAVDLGWGIYRDLRVKRQEASRDAVERRLRVSLGDVDGVTDATRDRVVQQVVEELGAALSEEGMVPEKGENNLWYSHGDSQAAIVFVHGVLSDSRGCWLNTDIENRPVFWPELIVQDARFRGVSVFQGGYYTAVDSGAYEIRDCADELFRGLRLADERGLPALLSKSRVTFVCHSTGGIVARYLLEKKHEEFKDKTVGLVLIASPSYGSKLADRLEWITKFYAHALGAQLQWGSWSLRDLDARFKDLVNDRRIPELHGIEAYENHFILHSKWFPGKPLVVTEESAGRYFGAPVLLRDTDHFSSVKPANTRHPAHRLLLDFMQDRGLLPDPSEQSTGEE